MDKCRLVSPTYTELHSAQVNLYTIFERSDLGTRSLAVSKFLILKEVNYIYIYLYTLVKLLFMHSLF